MFPDEDDDHSPTLLNCINEFRNEIRTFLRKRIGSEADDRKKKVGYVFSLQHIFDCWRHPRMCERTFLVHGLIYAYGLFKHMTIISPNAASEEELKSVHSENYIDFLKMYESCRNTLPDTPEKALEDYGLEYDCPLIDDIYSFVSSIAGGTISAAKYLVEDRCKIAIHWDGGWHHAQRGKASGYCYINDIVLGIRTLQQVFKRVMYLDLDLHHGDGVEDIFSKSKDVLFISLHKYEPCFFPGTGAVTDVGLDEGKYYTINVPLKDGIRDKNYCSIAGKVLATAFLKYRPEAVVCQCGADGLIGDPTIGFNLTLSSFGKCIKFIKTWNVPLLILGGGGYNFQNVARCWAYLTSILVDTDIEDTIPDNPFDHDLLPGTELHLMPGCRQDKNDDQYVDNILREVKSNLENINYSC